MYHYMAALHQWFFQGPDFTKSEAEIAKELEVTPHGKETS